MSRMPGHLTVDGGHTEALTPSAMPVTILQAADSGEGMEEDSDDITKKRKRGVAEQGEEESEEARGCGGEEEDEGYLLNKLCS